MPQREDAPTVGASECPLCGNQMEGYHCNLSCPNCGYREDCSDTFTAGPLDMPQEEREAAQTPRERPEE